MLELCLESAIEIQRQSVYTSERSAYFSVSALDSSNLMRHPYMKLLRLSQDMSVNLEALSQNYQYIEYSSNLAKSMKLDSSHMYRARDRQQTWYLPKSHSINILQHKQHNWTYNLSAYKNKQIPFCLTVLSHNNIQNNRYIKLMKSIAMQQYENYHIVFIDDDSTDGNMQRTRAWIGKIGFKKERIVYLQNLKRNFATFNIINAAFNYCGEDDVQVIVDGDDELIGRYVLQVMNALYQSKETWVAYSNYKTNFYKFGRSMDADPKKGQTISRKFLSIFGAVRTLRVQVLYNIPPLYHKMQNGDWLDTVYDDALFHSLLEISGYNRVTYVPELLYEYNTQYGDNDDSSSEKLSHRSTAYWHILRLPVLKQLDSLNGTVKNEEIVEELSRGQGVRYRVLE